MSIIKFEKVISLETTMITFKNLVVLNTDYFSLLNYLHTQTDEVTVR